MKRIVVASGILALALVLLSIGRDAGPAEAITVFDYTNVTEDSGCLLVPEGTAGAPLIAATGVINLGRGGSDDHPLDDTYRWGQFLPSAEQHAEFFDRIWYQINDAGTATFDLGEAFSEVYIALSQDHGPYPEEAIDYRLAVSNDNSSWMTLPTDTPITMYRRGWSAAGETVPCVGPFTAEPGGQVVDGGPWPDTANDDWSALWHLPAPYRYVQLTAIHHEPRYNDPEIDAVMGIESFTPRTIGFWKNWSSCDGNGNQDDVLDQTLLDAGGILIGDILVDTCEEAVSILDKSEVNADGEKMAKDAAYGLAAQLLAAKLNVQAGAAVPLDVLAAIADAQALLDLINFDGSGDYLPPKFGDPRPEALSLADLLDQYNNGLL